LTSLKQQLHSRCLTYIEERIKAAQEAIHIAQQSANEETKSSAGDKYETGRAMAQLEIEKNGVQLAEALRLKQTLEQIQPDLETKIARLGSIVITNQGNFYLAISAGQFIIDDKVYFVISPASPIGQKLMGLHVEQGFSFNKKDFSVLKIS
jgi:transcription elongation GreA/GreB family factor